MRERERNALLREAQAWREAAEKAAAGYLIGNIASEPMWYRHSYHGGNDIAWNDVERALLCLFYAHECEDEATEARGHE